MLEQLPEEPGPAHVQARRRDAQRGDLGHGPEHEALEREVLEREPFFTAVRERERPELEVEHGAAVARGEREAELRRDVTDRLVAKFQLPVTGWRGPATGEEQA